MRASLNSAELKNKRLMEAFKKKSHEFREVCFQLLGYRIDIPTDKQYHLMNIYAESPEDLLVFQVRDPSKNCFAPFFPFQWSGVALLNLEEKNVPHLWEVLFPLLLYEIEFHLN